ncbi:hypothetical protein BDV38DRAFT_243182 [Aspergillus pseudotamarii]|uniref:Uncharacterized protein n=1 Tax=Aspergillus pseudotamarii TaxID=132259 RepID=A0A5N6T097_ASPPS|nr:uncharacterized protein BDV38DRAFT_243182 [Aspergillus pseudotamarii]KAE8138884.1 hypothetical protein BDV38DRAFT_243182 [Aspergillus pseudotamarii]
MSVTFPVDYIMDVKLEANLGSDIPLYDRRFYNERCPDEVPSLKRVNGTTFNLEQEDYWLFCVHLNKAEMEFAIGGENPAYATSHPNWRNLSTKKDREFVLHHHEVGIFNAPCQTWCDFKLDFDRYVGIRCPKMTNPAITIKANGNHGEVKWVGLFVKSSVEEKNEFIAVKTTNRLLPAYAKRNESYEWYSPDRGVDVTNDRCIMLWPKQLYGTKGNRQDTYKQFVTVDPNSPLAARHITRVKERVKNGTALDVTAQGRSYTWNANSITEIWGTHTKPRGGGRGRSVFNYSAGTKVTYDDMEGVKILLRVFGTVTKMATGMVKGDFAAVLESIAALPQQFNNSSVDPDVKGFITALAALGQHQWNNRPRQPGSKEKTINTAGVELLSMKRHPLDSDFGCD